MLDLSTLNPAQRLAVETVKGPVLVLAGAGTGKTRVITMRIAHMLRLGAAPESIAAMTFTNKAAREMKERLQAVVGQSLANRVRLGTFHSFCLLILREFGHHIGLAKKFSLASTSDQIDLLRRGIQEERALTGVNVEALHAEISRAKNALLSPEDFARRAVHIAIGLDADALAKGYELYERQLKLNRLIDFDDCIFKVVTLLERFAEVRQQLTNRYRFFLVDEFQDTNAAQLKVLELIAKEHGNVCVVGDDDQSIYSWRGALAETLELFESMFPGTQLIKLEQNYRCTNIILSAANSVIRNNTQRKDKSLWSTSDEQIPIQVEACADEAEEARFIAEKCLAHTGDGLRAGDIAVLYRSNKQAQTIELALRELSIPYETFGGTSFFERKEVKDFLSYLRLIFKPDDRLAFWRVINTPHRGIGLRSLEKIEDMCQRKGKSPWAIISEELSELELPSRIAQSAQEFIAGIKELRARPLAQPEDIAQLGRDVIQKFSLVSDIRTHTKDAASQERKIENLKGLPAWLSTAAADVIKSQGSLDVYDLMDRLTMNDRDISDRDDKKANKVSLMTVHAAKGLEFPAVIVCGLEEELFPHKNSLGSTLGIAEERRLFYVALTRAKRKLTLTWTLERGTGVMKSLRQPSRFLKELPADGVSMNQTRIVGAQKAEERKAQTLSSLRSLKDGLRSLR